MAKDTSTELAVPEETLAALAALGVGKDPFAALLNMTAGQHMGMKPPPYVIEYGKTEVPKGVKLEDGLFTVADLTQAESIRAVLLDHALQYMHWGHEGYQPGIPPICKSNDGKNPLPNQAYRGPCGQYVCPEANFGKNGEAPACKKTYTLLFFDLDRMQPFLFQARGTGIKPYEKYFQNSVNMAIRKYGHEGLPGQCCFETLLGRREVKDSGKHYWPPTFAVGEQLPLEMAERMTQAFIDSRKFGVLREMDVEAAAQHPAEVDPEEDEIPF